MGLLFDPDAARQMKAMPKADRDRLIEALERVAADPSKRFPFVTEMAGRPGEWRFRKGDWRVIYRIEGRNVVVRAAGHRKDIYR